LQFINDAIPCQELLGTNILSILSRPALQGNIGGHGKVSSSAATRNPGSIATRSPPPYHLEKL